MVVRLIDWCARNRALVLLAALGLSGWGAWTMLHAYVNVSAKRAGQMEGSLSELVVVATLKGTNALLVAAMGELCARVTVGVKLSHAVVVSVTKAGAEALPKLSVTTSTTW